MDEYITHPTFQCLNCLHQSSSQLTHQILTKHTVGITDFLEKYPGTPTDPNSYGPSDHLFNLLNRLMPPGSHFANGEPEILLQSIVQIALDVEQKTNNRIHKGSIYYYWASVLFAHGQLESGFILLHQALKEDQYTQGKQTPDTPAVKLATLQEMSIEQKEFHQNLLSRSSHPISQSDFENKFLYSQSTSIEMLCEYSYTIHKLFEFQRFSRLKENLLLNLRQQEMLIRIARLIESYIKKQRVIKDELYDCLKMLLNECGKDSRFLKDVNNRQRNNFQTTLENLLNKSFVPSLQGIEKDIAITYCLRNFASHHVTNENIITNNFPQLYQSALNTFFLAVDKLG